MSGLRYDSIADMAPGMQRLAAQKLAQEAARPAPVAAPKYRNMQVEADGYTFASTKEYRRYLELMTYQEAGFIRDLRLQVNFTLIEGYTKPGGERMRPLIYKADFTYRVNNLLGMDTTAVSQADLEYWEENFGQVIIEDTKTRGTRTRTYINKYKLMADKGYEIREV